MSEELTTAKTTEIREGEFRDINTIRTEIRTLYNTAVRSELSYAIQLGHKLTEAKELVEYGEWGAWVKENLPFSQDKANMMMKIYENYGANQESLFGDLNSDTYRNLGVWQAFVLLSVPEEEREDFVKENHVEEMSVRELKQAIAERDAAQKKSAALEEDNKMLRQANIDLNMKAQNVGNLQKKAEEALARAKRAEASKDDTVKELQAARAELAEAKAKPAIPADMIEKMQTEAREAAEKETAEELERESSLREAAEKETEELRRKLAVASPETATYKAYFTMFQEDFNRLQGFLLKIGNTDKETAAKLKKALITVVDSFREKLNGNG